MVNSYKDLIVWQKSKKLAIAVYRVTDKFLKSELYGLTNQVRRAAISISSNIAEGSRRFHDKEKKQLFSVAFGSGAELESQIEISCELFPEIDFSEIKLLLEEVMKMLNSFIKRFS